MRSFAFSNPGFLALLGGAPTAPPVGPAAPAPGYQFFTETALVSSKQQLQLPGLASQEVVTVFLVLNKATLTEDLRMAFSILTAGNFTRTWVGYTGRSYTYNLGITYNTFVDGFVHLASTTLLDNEKTILLTAEMGRNGVTFYLNGVLQESISFRNAQARLEWSDEVILGGETNPAYDWQGIIYACYLYFGVLSEAEREATEMYLRTRFPSVN